MFADDLTLLSDSPSSGQQQCHLVQKFLYWSKIEAKVVKCSSLAFRSRPSSTFYNPKLKLCGQDISFAGDKSTTFLGLPINLCLSSCDIKSSILTKLEDLCERVDAAPILTKSKLQLYRNGIFPRLSWLLSVCDLPLTWIERQVEPIATRYLKKWCHLARPANVCRFYLPFKLGGLNLPSLSTSFKKCQVSRYHQLLNSKDARVQNLAMSKALVLATNKTLKFNPFIYVFQEQLKSLEPSQSVDDQRCLELIKACIVQGLTLRLQVDDDTWSKTVLSFKDRILSFCLNAIQNTLPHKSNLQRWQKSDSPDCPLCGNYQTLQHVLNNCGTAVKSGRYNWRHNSVLKCIYLILDEHLPRSWAISVDLPGLPCVLPSVISNSSLRPDIILWCQKTKELSLL